MILIGALGYAAVGALYVVLVVLLLTAWRGSRAGAYLILASVLSAIWGFALGVQTFYGTSHPLFVASIEMIRSGAWVIFLVSLVSQIGVSWLLRVLSVSVFVATLGALVFVFLVGPGSAVDSKQLAVVVTTGGLLITLLGLVLIEQLYRNSSEESRWALKFLVLGVGGIFAYDLFLYAQGMLLGALDGATWIARGAVNLIFIPMIAISARRNSDWEVRIFVSRQVVFHSTTLVAVGLYLLLMSLGGYVIALYGGSWGAPARVVFFTGAVVVLLTLLFSNTLRARARVFLSKHFFRNKYDYREEWLRLVATLEHLDVGSAGTVAVRAIAQVIASPAGAIWVRDDDDLFRLTARYETGDELPDIPHDDPLIQFIKKDGWLIDLAEYRQKPERYVDLQVPEWLRDSRRAWLLVPLQLSGELLGLILLYESPGTPRLNYEDRDLLKTVGNHIAVHLAQARADSLLAEAQQFEAYNRLTAFLMHDLKNLIAQQSLVVENAHRHKHKPEFIDDAIETIASSVARMKRILEQLTTGASDAPVQLTELKFIVSTAVDRCAAALPLPTLDINGVSATVAASAEEFTMVLVHLIRNAQDAAESKGRVAVRLQQLQDSAAIEISDDGPGMTPEFIRERLFRPFDSTKGSQGMGIGAYQAREFARKVGGDLEVRSVFGEGTKITLTVPIVTVP